MVVLDTKFFFFPRRLATQETDVADYFWEEGLGAIETYTSICTFLHGFENVNEDYVVFFTSPYWRYNLYIIKCTHFKCAI